MNLVTGALPSVLSKLAELLSDEYKLQKEAKNGITKLQTELTAIKALLEDISRVPPNKLKEADKFWATEVRELSYDIEDSIDKFKLRYKGDNHAEVNGFIGKTLDKLKHCKCLIRRKFATELRGLMSHVEDVSKRHHRYKMNIDITKSITIDPRVMPHTVNARDLVGVDTAKDELIQQVMQDKIVSIVGFGGLGKTTLAYLVYENLKLEADCSTFISVSQTPDMEKLFNDMMYGLLGKNNNNASMESIIRELNEGLKKKRYLIVIDDIWDIRHWTMIRQALPDNDIGCKIMTTTRFFDIAKKVGSVYSMKPLSLYDSKVLLHRTIYGKKCEEICPDKKLSQVSNRILKKCGGVPLAIVTVASLLVSKGRNEMEWHEVCDSIATGMENSLDVDNMRKILLLSYDVLPSYLRPCLLYLSMFPEDYKVEKDRLIWMWIAEGFIQCGKQGQRLFEVGESYLNELINRSMIQEETSSRCCYVHDMVLEIIRSLSSEENFIVVNGVDHTSQSKKIRRLSLRNSKIDHSKPGAAAVSMEQVRSMVAFSSAISVLPTLRNFELLRVLDLKACDLSQGYSLVYLGKLHHLRYLGLGRCDITQLPNEIGNLHFLQTLDIKCNTGSACLPLAICQLRNLMCLLIERPTRVPNGIGCLTSLEQLSSLTIEETNGTDIIEGLGYLTGLRVLDVSLDTELNEILVKCLVESLEKLEKVQRLSITSLRCEGNLDGWVVGPHHLRTLEVSGFWFSLLPSWINHLNLVDLECLAISVRTLQPESLEILGRLPALRYLRLTVNQIIGGFIVGASSFPSLVDCDICGWPGHVAFNEGAMPSVKRLTIDFRGESTDINILGICNLPALRRIIVDNLYGASKEVAEAALRHAVEIHPNHPEVFFLSSIRSVQEKIRVAQYVQRAAVDFIEGVKRRPQIK